METSGVASGATGETGSGAKRPIDPSPSPVRRRVQPGRPESVKQLEIGPELSADSLQCILYHMRLAKGIVC